MPAINTEGPPPRYTPRQDRPFSRASRRSISPVDQGYPPFQVRRSSRSPFRQRRAPALHREDSGDYYYSVPSSVEAPPAPRNIPVTFCQLRSPCVHVHSPQSGPTVTTTQGTVCVHCAEVAIHAFDCKFPQEICKRHRQSICFHIDHVAHRTLTSYPDPQSQLRRRAQEQGFVAPNYNCNLT